MSDRSKRFGLGHIVYITYICSNQAQQLQSRDIHSHRPHLNSIVIVNSTQLICQMMSLIAF